jgi:hypothetical protein
VLDLKAHMSANCEPGNCASTGLSAAADQLMRFGQFPVASPKNLAVLGWPPCWPFEYTATLPCVAAARRTTASLVCVWLTTGGRPFEETIG